ncbi:MAG: winged helix-turn-helix domain-containing protein [Rhizobiaceae bacterium]|nr:winged helix-turn-helix domain-containing protein [Rhizobiaceae bacterium]MCV0408697.1 winged helix-turn-helix domain-containing protein [Rhizobiaceae bacterium]
MEAARRYRFGSFVLDLGRMTLFDGDRPVELRPKAFDTLKALVARAGRVVSKDELVGEVWPGIFVNDDALAQCVRDVRKALGDEAQTMIRTVPKRGYLFAGNVTVEEHDGQPRASQAVSPSGRRITVVASAVVAMLAAAITGLWFGYGNDGGGQAIARDPRPTVAVTPFRANVENDEDAWLGEGLADEIIMALSRFRDIAVIARNSSFRQPPDVELAQLRAELGADFLLQGSVRRAGDTLRLAVQHVDLESGVNRWTERFDRPWGDVFEIQERVAAEVASQLAAQTREAAVVRSQGKPPSVLDAYELVLRARKAYLTFSREGAFEGIQLVRRAIDADPNYAVAWELLAQLLLQFFIQPYDERRGDPALIAEARAAAARAVALDPSYSAAHATLGALVARGGDFDAGLAQLQEALRLNPNDATTLGTHADLLARAGLHAESLAAWQTLERLDPVGTPLAAGLKSRAHFFLGEYEAALAAARRCVARAPKLQPCQLFHTIAARAAGEDEEAAESARRLMEINPDFSIQRHFTIISFRDPADVEAMAVHLRAAGLPE